MVFLPIHDDPGEDFPADDSGRSVGTNGENCNEQVITGLFEAYNQRICTYLGHLVGNDETGRDLAQETFLKAWKALPSLRHPAQTEAWLFRIARNTALDYFRKKLPKVVLPWSKMEEHEATGNLKAEGFEDQVSEQECVKQAGSSKLLMNQG
jgi:RNA polymerase sigma factor (sigma-70 family)